MGMAGTAGARLSPFRLSKDGQSGKARRGGDLEVCGATEAAHAYLGARWFAAQVVESGRLKTAHSKVEPARAGLRRKGERVNADGTVQALASSSSRRTWKARLPILRATVGLATDVSRRARVAR